MKKILSALAELLNRSSISGPVIGVISFVIVALFSLTQVYELFELKLYDIRFSIKPRTAQWDRLTFLDIDDNSINSIGQFPWPRTVYAAGLEVLKEAGIRQVAFDIQFPDESPAMVDKAKAAGLIEKASKGKRLARADIDAVIIDNDAALAKAIAGQAHFILPYSFQKERFVEKEADAAKKHEAAKTREFFTARASIPVPADRKALYRGLIDPGRVAIMYPIAPLVSQTRLFGFVDSDFDPDGISRRIRLVRNFNDRLYFHMSIVMLMDCAA
jgi:CHASE2 domain-containing sensor protein